MTSKSLSFKIPTRLPRKMRGMLATVGVAALCASTMSLAATAYESASKADHQYRYLSEALDRNKTRQSLLSFAEDVSPVGRDFTEIDKTEIAKDVTQAWANFAIALSSGDKAFLQDHFLNTALEKVETLAENAAREIDQGMVVLDQTARPRFFHADGSVFEMISDDTLVVRYRLDRQDDNIEFLSVTRDCTRQILFLKTAGWKIRNHEMDCSIPVDPENTSRKLRTYSLPVKGMNYYPAKTPWQEFWPEFDAELVRLDMDRMAKMGINSLRIFIPFDQFTDPVEKHAVFENLDGFLKLAAEYRISVMPTLFDFRGSYTPSRWAEDYQYLKEVVGLLRDHDNVQIIDLKNEPDLDYKHQGEALVDAWLIVFSKLLQEMAPEISVTIGWLHADNAARMANIVDTVSYHEYGKQSEAAKLYSDVKRRSGFKTVLVTETGKPSWSFAAGLPFSDNSQARWLERQLEAMKRTDGVFLWTLHDFEYADTAGIATLPWRRAMQASYGLFDTHGQEKPAAELYRNFDFNGNWSRKTIKERIQG